jgi:hypothetical protein
VIRVVGWVILLSRVPHPVFRSTHGNRLNILHPNLSVFVKKKKKLLSFEEGLGQHDSFQSLFIVARKGISMETAPTWKLNSFNPKKRDKKRTLPFIFSQISFNAFEQTQQYSCWSNVIHKLK